MKPTETSSENSDSLPIVEIIIALSNAVVIVVIIFSELS